MIFRYPDKPVGNMSREALDALPTIYLAQLKMDGWRDVVTVHVPNVHGDGIVYNATHTSRERKTLPVTPELAGRVDELLRHVPPDTILDGEWLARRPACRTAVAVRHHGAGRPRTLAASSP